MKKGVGVKNCLYPMLTTLVGANVNGKPNFITLAHVGIMNLESISLSMNKGHYTNAGIKENGTFSVNIPSINMIKETDYCGMVSGKNVDKAALFKTFYGKLETAPMIEECPLNMECKLMKTIVIRNHDIFIGEIVATYYDDSILTNGLVDISKVQPILFVIHGYTYWSLGEKIGRAKNIGSDIVSKNP